MRLKQSSSVYGRGHCPHWALGGEYKVINICNRRFLNEESASHRGPVHYAECLGDLTCISIPKDVIWSCIKELACD